MRGIEAGKLRQRVTIYRPAVPDRDSIGEPTRGMVKVCEVSASVMPVDSSEVFDSQRVVTVGTHLITIRYRGEIGSDWEFEFNDRRAGKVRRFKIDGKPISPEECSTHLECVCKEIG